VRDCCGAKVLGAVFHKFSWSEAIVIKEKVTLSGFLGMTTCSQNSFGTIHSNQAHVDKATDPIEVLAASNLQAYERANNALTSQDKMFGLSSMIGSVIHFE
jgi:hypothetical protein